MRAAKLQMKPNITQLFAALDDSSDSEKSEQSEQSEQSDLSSDFSSDFQQEEEEEEEEDREEEKAQSQSQEQTEKKEEYPKFRVWKTESTEQFSSLFYSKKPKIFSGEKQSKDPVTVFRSFLTNETVEENKGKLSEEKEALAWAEKIKITLEKAERQKYESRIPAGRISFFRKKIQLDEKF
jgi:hypothetical protein